MKKLIFGIFACTLFLGGCGQSSNEATPTTSVIPPRPPAPVGAGSAAKGPTANVVAER
jgi:nitrous oxide reductase accessory protein NosL